MPQLDQFTYLTQFVWLCVFFMSFYVLLYNDGLPKVSRILKLRAQLVSKQGDTVNRSHQQVEQDKVIQEALNNSASYLHSSVFGASQWCNEMVTQLNITELEPINQAYVRSIGEISVSQVIKANVFNNISAFTTFPKNAHKLSQIYAIRTPKMRLITAKNGPRKKKPQNA